MGLSQSTTSASPPSTKLLDESFLIVCDESKPLPERRKAFNVLRNRYAPATQHLPSYSEELKRVFALRYDHWSDVSYVKEGRKEVVRDSVRGCLFGNALGDAAGLAGEFLSRQQIELFYGADFSFFPSCEVYPDSHRLSFPAGDWTDDTDQLILALQSLLETKGRFDPKNIAAKLVQWKEEGFSGLGDVGGSGLGQNTKTVLLAKGFLDNPLLTSREVWERGGRKNAANGAVMRTAITGIVCFWDLSEVERNTVDLCLVTHADPRCVSSCVMIATIIALILQHRNSNNDLSNEEEDESGVFALERIIDRSSERAMSYLTTREEKEEFLRHINVSVSLRDLSLDEAGKIGYTFKCMGAAIWAVRQAAAGREFGEVVEAVIREGGDADTNCAVAGGVVGVLVGYSRLPGDWLRRMPYEVWLDAWAQKLCFLMHLL